MNKVRRVAVWAITILFLPVGVQANDLVVREFEKQQLTPVYWSEGANHGDFNQDGHQDVVSGPHIWLGPDFKHRYEYYPAVAPTKRLPNDFGFYSNDNFFSFVHDINDDGWPDVLTVGLPKIRGRPSAASPRNGRSTGSGTSSPTASRTKPRRLAT